MSAESIHPFRLDVAQSELDDLHRRLVEMRWPDEVPDPGWMYGVPRDYLRELVSYWLDGYDWRRAEADLNAWPQYTTMIDGTRVHFVHLCSPEPEATPVIMTHAWPGSIVEFGAVAGPLTDPRPG